MPLKDYTTEVPVERTLGEIQRMLARAGARSIFVEFDDAGEPRALSFSFLLTTEFGGKRSFALPANVEGVQKTLAEQYRRGQVERRHATRQHAARVAWRIIRDWLAAQLAIMESGQVSFEQVMLPYLVVEENKTLYQAIAERRFALPAAERRALGPGRDG